MKCSCHSDCVMDWFVLGFFVRKEVKPWKNEELDDTGCWPMSAVVPLKQFICKSKSCIVVEISIWVGPTVGFNRFSLEALLGKCICHVKQNQKTGNSFETEMLFILWNENLCFGWATTPKTVAAVVESTWKSWRARLWFSAELVLKEVLLKTSAQVQGAEGNEVKGIFTVRGPWYSWTWGLSSFPTQCV